MFARYMGVRESFIDDWNPQGGIEVAMIDMLAQSYFQWQFWLEQTVKRSKTRPRGEHHAYQEWKRWNEKNKHLKSWQEGYWFPPYVSEQQAIEHAVQMVDRFNRICMQTFRQLRDLRHSMATLLFSEGVNPNIVSERLGHASIVLTLDTYSHVLPGMQKEASNKLGQMLFG